MKPWIHAKISANKFGGNPEDYIEIHNWFDQTKAHIPDSRHRLVLHNSFGIYLAEQQFGTFVQKSNGTFIRTPIIKNSDGKDISVRDIAEQHVLDDLGHIPTLDECIQVVEMPEEVNGRAKVRPLRMNKNSNIRIVD